MRSTLFDLALMGNTREQLKCFGRSKLMNTVYCGIVITRAIFCDLKNLKM